MELERRVLVDGEEEGAKRMTTAKYASATPNSSLYVLLCSSECSQSRVASECGRFTRWMRGCPYAACRKGPSRSRNRVDDGDDEKSERDDPNADEDDAAAAEEEDEDEEDAECVAQERRALSARAVVAAPYAEGRAAAVVARHRRSRRRRCGRLSEDRIGGALGTSASASAVPHFHDLGRIQERMVHGQGHGGGITSPTDTAVAVVDRRRRRAMFLVLSKASLPFCLKYLCRFIWLENQY